MPETNPDQVNKSPEPSFWESLTQSVIDNVSDVIDRTTAEAGKAIADTTTNVESVINQAGKAIADTTTNVESSINQMTSGINSAIAQITPDHAEIRTKAEEIGGGFAGAIAGEVIGGTIGGIAGTVVLGPVTGTILGNQLGSFIGFIIGAQVGEEVVLQSRPVKIGAVEKINSFEERLKLGLRKRGGDKVGDAVGAITGGVIGGTVLGPVGVVIGSSIGGAFGGRIGEDAALALDYLGNQTSPTPDPDKSESIATWFDSTSKSFVGESVTTTVGGIVGGAVLGIPGSNLGRKLGTFVGRKLDWNGILESPPVLSPALESQSVQTQDLENSPVQLLESSN